MAACLAVWSALFLPGFALLRLLDRKELQSGLLGAVAASYLASFALLAPIALLGYTLRLPLAVLSGSMVVLVIAALGVLLRSGGWKPQASTFKNPELIVGLILLLVHLLMELRIGTWMQGDATYHVGRVRFLLDHGLSSRDIYVAADYPSPVYHANLLHAVLAAGCQLTGTDPLEFWFHSLVWSKLVIAAGHGYLAFAVFGERWTGWVTAALVATTQAGMTYALYPNTLAVGWLLPTLLGVCVRWCAEPRCVASGAAKLAIGAGVISLVHALYGVFLALCVCAFLIGRALFLLLTRRSPSGSMLYVAALLVAAPAVLVARTGGVDADDAPGQAEVERDQQLLEHLQNRREAMEAAQESKASRRAERRKQRRIARAGGGHLDKSLEQLDDGTWVLAPQSLGGTWFLLSGGAALLLAIVRLPKRRAQLFGIASVCVAIGLILFVPALCTAAVETAGAPFIIVRLVPILSSLLFASWAGGLLALTGPSPPPLLAAALMVLAAAAGTQKTGHSPQRFRHHVREVLKPQEKRLRQLRRLEERQELLRRHIPAGTTVATTLPMARAVVMLHDVHVIATDRASSVPRINARRVDVLRLTTGAAAHEQREQILSRYEINHAVFASSDAGAFNWAVEHGKVLDSRANWTVVLLPRSP